ncbi:hypothetical protein T492DRAFT_901119 [Pavlovales sp. CCMP2436]|nr:hypothetical protein T492DRAFT_901119 [Pavlovales sp. CCMP2436]
MPSLPSATEVGVAEVLYCWRPFVGRQLLNGCNPAQGKLLARRLCALGVKGYLRGTAEATAQVLLTATDHFQPCSITPLELAAPVGAPGSMDYWTPHEAGIYGPFFAHCVADRAAAEQAGADANLASQASAELGGYLEGSLTLLATLKSKLVPTAGSALDKNLRSFIILGRVHSSLTGALRRVIFPATTPPAKPPPTAPAALAAPAAPAAPAALITPYGPPASLVPPALPASASGAETPPEVANMQGDTAHHTPPTKRRLLGALNLVDSPNCAMLSTAELARLSVRASDLAVAAAILAAQLSKGLASKVAASENRPPGGV